MQDPWLVMHKIDSPTKMRYVGNRVAACNASDPSAVPKSIAEFVKRPGAKYRMIWSHLGNAVLTDAGRLLCEFRYAQRL